MKAIVRFRRNVPQLHCTKERNGHRGIHIFPDVPSIWKILTLGRVLSRLVAFTVIAQEDIDAAELA